MPEIHVGQLVLSTAGRDQENAYLISEILDPPYVLVVDGAAHRLGNPKKKNLRHLAVTAVAAEEFSGRRDAGKVPDELVRQMIKRLLTEAQRG